MSRSVVCTQCGHSLSMSDDIYNRRVAGKVVTIKCRQCSTPIRVDGRQDAAAATTSQAPSPSSSHDDPLDPFSMPEPQDTLPKPRAPLPSLDEVVSSAPHIPAGLEAAARRAPEIAFASKPEAPAPPAAPQAPGPPPPARGAPPAPPPRARASAPEAVEPTPPQSPPPSPAAAPARQVADAPSPVAAPAPPAPPAPPPAPGPGAFAAAPVAQAAPQAMAQPAPPAAPTPGPFGVAPAPVHEPAPAPQPMAAVAPVGESFEIARAAPLPQDLMIDPATMRDPHAAFRKRSPTRALALAGGAAALLGGLIFATRGGDEKEHARPQAAQPEKPVIGVSLAPYRSDAHETMPTPAAPSKPPASNGESGDSPPVETGSSEDFAERFKAASGRE